MAATFSPVEFVIATIAVFPLLCHGYPAALTLERALPLSPQADLGLLVRQDRVRHSMILQSSSSSSTSSRVVDFQLHGSTFGLGIYYTRIHLGSPPRDFYVQIDTGSDILWISCMCKGCPLGGLVNSPRSYDPRRSSTAHSVNCTDKRCLTGCPAKGDLCPYTLYYADGSSTSGYYVSDLLHFQTTLTNSSKANATVPIIFGCSTQVMDPTSSFWSVDGIFGLGQHGLSVISQLTSQRLAPKAFSLCLRGDSQGGGHLVLDAVEDPNMVYTPIVASQPHYNVNLRSISVNGQRVAIDPSVFATSNNGGTIVDSGTTLAYLVGEAYDPFVHAVTAVVSQAARPFLWDDAQCYSTTSSVNMDVFPKIRLDFEGRASLSLDPKDYVRLEISTDNARSWCLGFLKNQGLGLTVLGDMVLRDKMFVYDLAAQRIGWVNYNCSMPVNDSTIDTGNSRHDNSTGGTRHRVSLGVVTLPWTVLSWVVILFPMWL